MKKARKSRISYEAIKKRILQHKKAIIISVVVLLLALPTTYPQYIVTAILCGRQPIAATSFAAAWHYYLPGETFYKVGPFMQYYCTPQEAEAAGFSHPGV